LVDGVPPFEVVPTQYLRPAEADAERTGLTGAYYANPDLGGEPTLLQVDRIVDFIWKDTTPLTGRWGDWFSICWTGFLVPPASGLYRLGVDGFSGYKLFLGGELITEYADIHHPVLKSTEVALEGGRFYPLRLELVSRGLDPQARLLWARPDVEYEAPALEVAARADLIVAVMGLSPRLEGEEMPVQVDGFVGGDRSRIELPRQQEEFLMKLHSLGKPIVLVLLNGSALAIPWAAENIPAIVEGWYPGQAGGEALADVLFGDYNPGGRLPVTFYESTEDLPPFTDYRMEGRTYRFLCKEPLFPFGFGLSYTDFSLDSLELDPAQVPVDGQVTVSVRVTNIGERAGDEVVQLYVRHPKASVPRPTQELKGFWRIFLEPGECKSVVFTLDTRLLGYYDESMHYTIVPGTVEVLVGSSSKDLPLAGRFEIVGQATVVKHDKVFFSQVRAQQADACGSFVE
jgi:beta-glucosidase